MYQLELFGPDVSRFWVICIPIQFATKIVDHLNMYLVVVFKSVLFWKVIILGDLTSSSFQGPQMAFILVLLFAVLNRSITDCHSFLYTYILWFIQKSCILNIFLIFLVVKVWFGWRGVCTAAYLWAQLQPDEKQSSRWYRQHYFYVGFLYFLGVKCLLHCKTGIFSFCR